MVTFWGRHIPNKTRPQEPQPGGPLITALEGSTLVAKARKRGVRASYGFWVYPVIGQCWQGSKSQN